jgi:uncharacterized protein YaaQ
MKLVIAVVQGENAQRAVDAATFPVEVFVVPVDSFEKT